LRFDVLTLFPEFIMQGCSFSIIKRAVSAGLIEINTVNPRDYTLDKHKKTDDTPYGGGSGMLLMCQPYLDALKNTIKLENSKTIIMSPQGRCFNQKTAEEFAQYNQLIILCGHYEGFDERIKVLSGAEEISIGDFVSTGGELPALCIIDTVSRLVKGVLGSDESALNDSHSDGLLEYPQYTKPGVYEGLEAPEVLLSGNHQKIQEWRRIQQFKITRKKRPDLFEKFLKSDLNSLDKKLLKKFYEEENK